MGRKDLVNELIDFICKYKLFSNAEDLRTETESIERHLEISMYVEGLIQLLITKAKYIENMDFARLNKLLSELEDIRLELEYAE